MVWWGKGSCASARPTLRTPLAPPPQTAVRQCYCLTEGDLRKLGNIRRANSHNRNWQPTCLYLESQVQRVGGLGGGGGPYLSGASAALL